MTTTTTTAPRRNRRRDAVLAAWDDYCDDQYRRAEAEAIYLLDPARRDEFIRTYGSASAVRHVMFNGGQAAAAYYFASEELLRWWEANPPMTWSEFAYGAGIRDRRTSHLARMAPGHREIAARRAWARVGARR